MNDRDIEDTREPKDDGADADELWEQVQDCLSDDLYEFVQDEITEVERKCSFYMRQVREERNRAALAGKELDACHTLIDRVLDNRNVGMCTGDSSLSYRLSELVSYYKGMQKELAELKELYRWHDYPADLPKLPNGAIGTALWGEYIRFWDGYDGPHETIEYGPVDYLTHDEDTSEKLAEPLIVPRDKSVGCPEDIRLIRWCDIPLPPMPEDCHD